MTRVHFSSDAGCSLHPPEPWPKYLPAPPASRAQLEVPCSMKLGRLERQILIWLWANREGQTKRSYGLPSGMWGPHDLAEGFNGGGITRSHLVSIVRAGKRLEEKGLLWSMRDWRARARTRMVHRYFVVDGQVCSGYRFQQRYPCEWFSLTPYGMAVLDTLGDHIQQGKRLRHQMLQMALESPILNVSCLGCERVGRWNADEWSCVAVGYWHKPCLEEGAKKFAAATTELLKAVPLPGRRKAWQRGNEEVKPQADT